jgi:hypothetical protein
LIKLCAVLKWRRRVIVGDPYVTGLQRRVLRKRDINNESVNFPNK